MTEIGEGILTVLAQVATLELGVRPEALHIFDPASQQRVA